MMFTEPFSTSVSEYFMDIQRKRKRSVDLMGAPEILQRRSAFVSSFSRRMSQHSSASPIAENSSRPKITSGPLNTQNLDPFPNENTTASYGRILALGRSFDPSELPMFHRSELFSKTYSRNLYAKVPDTRIPADYRSSSDMETKGLSEEQPPITTNAAINVKTALNHSKRTLPDRQKTPKTFQSIPFRSFVMVAASFLLLAFGAHFVYRGIMLKGQVLGASKLAYSDMISAVDQLKSKDLQSSAVHFQEAYENFSTASEQVSEWGGFLTDISAYIPFATPLSSGANALEAGKHFAAAGQRMSAVAAVASELENPFSATTKIPLTQSVKTLLENMSAAKDELVLARGSIDKVNINDLPEEKREAFAKVKNSLPEIITALEGVDENGNALMDMLGANGPRKYLFLFQNNHEARATGGFIGSYGFLDLKDGKIRKFFINGIFDPDGQLKVDVIPPKPIQKVSAGWSLHDSNWFSDFPLSARKAIYFYEKTGGPTVDGVIAITPEVLRKLLEVSGPIYLPKYDVTVDARNFMENIQYEVEVDYDKKENKPKKILSDLAPVLLEKTLQFKDFSSMIRILDAFSSSIEQKHMLLYSSNAEIQKTYSQLGWTGELREAPFDFLQVVNSNVNGYKTDGVVEQAIEHNAVVERDGSIIDTVTVTRSHKGGDSQHDWWNRVNANYMRVYVPRGSTLLSAEGHTREVDHEPPVDYKTLGFTIDEDVAQLEQSTAPDPESGTRVGEESGKTVFGNWVYVSPRETVTVRYTYKLPFRIETTQSKEVLLHAYSLLTQKQSGSMGSRFSHSLSFPESWKIAWKYPENSQNEKGILRFSGNLVSDMFISAALQSDRN